MKFKILFLGGIVTTFSAFGMGTNDLLCDHRYNLYNKDIQRQLDDLSKLDKDQADQIRGRLLVVQQGLKGRHQKHHCQCNACGGKGE